MMEARRQLLELLCSTQARNGTISTNEAHEMWHKQYSSTPPLQVKPVPMVNKCLDSLNTFFVNKDPPVVTERTPSYRLVFYGFVDASNQGFGSILQGEDDITYRVGTWGTDSEANSSNWREFCNLVDTIEDEAENGKLDFSVIIVATDNTTVEGCFYKGNSTSPLL